MIKHRRILIFMFILVVSISFTAFNYAAIFSSASVSENSLGFYKEVNLTFEQALEKTKAELKKQGFGILTQVDIKATMKKKLDLDYRPYHILGACNPALANQALTAEPQIGLMLPCKWIVYVNDQDKTIVAAVDPVKMMDEIENEELTKVAGEVQKKFRMVLTNI